MIRNTIAIIGATEEQGPAIVKSLANTTYRLLLFDVNIEKLAALEKEIKAANPGADIEIMHCEADASWEADIIIINVPDEAKNEITEKIKMFATRKVVIILSANDTLKQWEQLLPDTKLARAGITMNNKVVKVLVTGHNEEAMTIAGDLLTN